MNILITGVSKGLGLTTVQYLLAEGYSIYGISRTTNADLDKLKQDYPNHFFHLSYDLANVEDINKSIFKTFLKNVSLDGFVNNAALAYDDIATNLNIEALENMFRVNVYSPFNLTKYVLRNFLLYKKGGSIIHISSISVHTGYKGLSMYASTKGALEAYSKNIAREWGEMQVRSNCIVSGFMDTEMSAKLSDDQKNRIYNRTSLKQPTEPSSIAATIEWLLSNKSKSVTGQNIFVDSGTI
jgi:3-oxoacyl-[acyl-carrier protein] reductase